MAITATFRRQLPGTSDAVGSVTWVLANAENGEPIQPDWAAYSDCSIQATVTGTPGTFVWQVSHDGTNWFTASTPAGVAISLTAAGFKQVLESFLYARPSVSGGDGTTAWTVIAKLRKPNRGQF